MAVLHFRILGNNENVILDRTIDTPSITLRRVTIVMNEPETAANLQNFKGGLILEPEFLKTSDLTSMTLSTNRFFTGTQQFQTTNSNSIYFPIQEVLPIAGSAIPLVFDRYFDLNYSLSQEIPRSFKVTTRKYDNGSENVKYVKDVVIPQVILGAIKYIDVFYEYNDNNLISY